MSRSEFGWWGSELDDQDFARALAALGVLTGFRSEVPHGGLDELKSDLVDALRTREVLTWCLTCKPGELIDHYAAPDAGKLSRAWAETHWSPGPRLEILPYTEGKSFLPWIVEQLSSEAVGSASVFVRLRAPTVQLPWSWPLRVGLLEDAESARLRSGLEEAWWAGHLATFRTAGARGEPCDLLFVPWTLRWTLGELLRQPRPIRAHCVVVLGGVDTPWERAEPQLKALLADVKASGIYVTSMPEGKAGGWFDEFLRQVSHNHPLDVAFQTAARLYGAVSPLFFASERLLTSSRMSDVVQELIRRLERLSAETEMNVPDPLREPMKLTGAPRPAAALARDLEAYSSSFRYDGESHEASALADLNRETAEKLDDAPPTSPRWIQGQVFDLRHRDDPQILRRALRAGQRHLLVVRIGPADEEWLTPPAEAVFPEHKLPRDEEQHKLRVVFSEPNHAPEPQTATIMLPRAGPSSTCQFPFQTRSDVPTFQGRVIVLHRNRVLQTALLEGQVLPDPAKAREDLTLQLGIEGLIRPVLQDLDLRQDFDLALVANHTPDGQPGITSIADEWAEFKSLGPQQDSIVEDISVLLEDIADRPEHYRHDLTHEHNLKLLEKLARLGNKLYEGLIGDQVKLPKLQGIRRVQLVSAREDYLPLEFFYDLQTPKRGAQVCPRALVPRGNGGGQVLRDEKCQDCPEAHRRPAEYVCPLGFWCMRLVIERHAVNPEWVRKLDGYDFALQSMPVPGRKPLRPLTNAVYAASDLVDEVEQGHIQRVFEALQEATERHATQVTTWEKWVKVIDSEKPALLLLLPHTTADEENEPLLEIGTGQQLVGEYISTDHVRPPESGSAPVVVLVGCKTLQHHISISSFPAYFRRRGAAVVLSTLTSVLGRHAGPVAEQLVDHLQDLVAAAEEERSFGYAMLRLRRQALANGLLMVLCLVAHGDADYRLEKSERS